MRRKNVTNAIIRESITEALLLLMQVQPFAQITITDLVQKAGVSRVSFYRNFESKEDVLLCRLDETARSWWASFPEEPENSGWIASFMLASFFPRIYCIIFSAKGKQKRKAFALLFALCFYSPIL